MQILQKIVQMKSTDLIIFRMDRLVVIAGHAPRSNHSGRVFHGTWYLVTPTHANLLLTIKKSLVIAFFRSCSENDGVASNHLS